jgi:DNA processing protein
MSQKSAKQPPTTAKTSENDVTGRPPKDIVDRLRLIRSESVGPVTYHALIARFGSAENALRSLQDLARRGGRRKPLRIFGQTEAEDEIAEAKRHNAIPITPRCPAYPSILTEISDAPPFLYAIGRTGLLQEETVAVVGARNASAVGLRFANELAADLGRHQIVVASGLARGIDEAAHRGALPHGTVAVMAGGLDKVYPPEHIEIFEQICAEGCALSEMPPGTVPQARHFPRRNRIVSGISRAVVVVEGAMRSGSLITARLAGEQGREVLAVPGSPRDPRARGPNALLRQGAAMCETVDDVLSALSLPHRAVSSTYDADPPQFDENDTAPTEDTRRLLLARLSVTPVDIDDLARSCTLAAPVVATTLLELELAGRVYRLPGHRVQLAA